MLLAGGRSSRMGRPKGLLDLAGRPWLEAQLARLARAGGGRAVVVLGHDEGRYLEQLPWLDAARRGTVRRAGVDVLALGNTSPEHGQFSSLQCGVRGLVERGELGDEGLLVLPVDVPCPGRPALLALVSSLGPGVEACVPERLGRGGHPVLLSASFARRLLGLPPQARLDVELRAAQRPGGHAVVRVPVLDPSTLDDLDTPQDWARFCREQPAPAAEQPSDSDSGRAQPDAPRTEGAPP